MPLAIQPNMKSVDKIIIVQPALATYREMFFERLYSHFQSKLSVFASSMDELSSIENKDIKYSWLTKLKKMKQVVPGLDWQPNVLSIKLRRGNILVLSGQPRTITNSILFIKAKLLGVKVIWWGHHMSSTSKPWRARIRFLLMSFMDACLFYTDKEAERFKKQCPSYNGKIWALNNGIEIKEIVGLRNDYDHRYRSKDLLFIGRLTKKSKIDLLFKAMHLDHNSSYKLDIIGDGDIMHELKSRARFLKIDNRITWHGAITNEKKLAPIINKCKVFVYPGAVGLSLIHAFSYGLPSIIHSNRKKQMPESDSFRELENGISFIDENPSSLSDAVNYMLSADLNKMSKQAIETTRNNFNAEIMSKRFVSLISEISNEDK